MELTSKQLQGGLLCFARIHCDKSRLEVASEMDTAQQNIWAIEMGRQNITLEYQDQLLAVLKMTPIELLYLVPAYLEHLEKCLKPEDIDKTDKN